MINYEVFYKRFGVRTPTQLMVPITPGIDKFEFPRNSVHHYVITDSVLEGPPSDEYFYRTIEKKIAVDHLFSLTGDKGPPKKVAINLQPYARSFQMKNKRYRYYPDAAETVKDPMMLVVVNYGLLPRSVRYMRNMYTEYNKWWNIQKTLWTKVAKTAQASDRQQYIFTALPAILPSVSKLDLHTNKFSQQTLRALDGPNAWFILEMWKWLSEEHRYESVIGDIPQEDLKKVNLVIQESGRFLMINLGLLDSWRQLSVGEPNPQQKVKIRPPDLQRRFLRMLMGLMAERSLVTPTPIEEESAVGDLSIGGDDDDIDPDDPDALALPSISDKLVKDEPDESAIVQPETTAMQHIAGDVQDDDEYTKSDRANDILARLDDDLAQLELIDRDNDSIEDEESVAGSEVLQSKKHSLVDFNGFDIDLRPEDKIKEICDDLADDGLITAAEYRRFLNMSGNYKHLIAPDGKSTLEQHATITEEALKVEPVEFTDMPTVVDKTMLESKLIDFQSKYNKDILHRDVSSMLVNAQKGGFAITKYETEKIKNILGEYEIHTVRITPIQGVPSTLRFKLPVIDDDGVFKNGGIKYRLRLGRRDQPIAKTSYDKVGLSTYFGKTFVTRSDKKVYDRGQWLRDQIIAKGMDSSDETITDVSPGDVFDNKFPAPKAYTSVAMGIKSFKSNNYTFVFNKDSPLLDEKITKKYNKAGSVVVAVNDAGEHLVMDNHNALYAITNEGLQPKGSFESFVGIDTLHSPVDFAQVKIYGKNLPVAIVLGYMYGLDRLLEMLKSNPRRVPTGSRVHLQPDEFAITFADEVLVFSRDDQLASMIFGGFEDYKKVIKNYSVHTFDKPDVYLNVLESQGIGPRYLREIQMFNDLFVDPISREILKKKGQPTTFPGLLVKATEALLTDTHPDALDMEQMRIVGNERMAGAVYAEICQSIRNHKVSSNKSHQPIDLSPNAVWKRISEDTSLSIASDINPIKNLKEKEAVTFSGTGGRTSRSMVRATREFHPNDLGVISEGTVDNSDVGINTYLSGNPNFMDVRGMTQRYDLDDPNPTSLMSSAALLSVGSDRDDMKRVNSLRL